MPCDDPNCICHTAEKDLLNLAQKIEEAKLSFASRVEAYNTLEPAEAALVARTSERLEALLDEAKTICEKMQWPFMFRAIEVGGKGLLYRTATGLPDRVALSVLLAQTEGGRPHEFANMAAVAFEFDPIISKEEG